LSGRATLPCSTASKTRSSQDTLPAYQDLLATDPARAQQIVASDFNHRVGQYRPTNNLPVIMDRFLDGFDAEVHQ
jgi:hypothetical protein